MRFADDIPLELAINAHAGTSWTPTERGRQEVDRYSRSMAGAHAELLGIAEKKGLADAFLPAWDAFRESYRRLVIVYLTARSHCVSTMIAGPAHFPARRAQKNSERADNAARAAEAYWRDGIERLRKLLHPEERPIMAGDGDAVERMRVKLAAHEARHAEMIAANKASRGSYDTWEIRNSGYELRRLKAQLTKLEKLKARPVEVFQGPHGKVEVDPPNNRVRLFFSDDEKGKASKAALKNRGFRWAPSIGGWSAYVNERTIALAKEMAGVQ